MFLHLLLLGSISPLLAEYEVPDNITNRDVSDLINDDDDVPTAKNSSEDISKTVRSDYPTQPNRTATLHYLEYEVPTNRDVSDLMNDDDDVPTAKNSSEDIAKTFRSDYPTRPNRTAILHYLGYNESYLSSLGLPKDFTTKDVEELRKKYETDLTNDFNKYINEQDINKYIARALPKPKPFWTIWKVLLIVKLILAIIYWYYRCVREKEEKEEEENEKNGEKELCKIP